MKSFKIFINQTETLTSIMEEMASSKYAGDSGIIGMEFFKDNNLGQHKLKLHVKGKEREYNLETITSSSSEMEKSIIDTIHNILVKKKLLPEGDKTTEEKVKLIIPIIKQDFVELEAPWDIVIKNGKIEIHKEKLSDRSPSRFNRSKEHPIMTPTW